MSAIVILWKKNKNLITMTKLYKRLAEFYMMKYSQHQVSVAIRRVFKRDVAAGAPAERVARSFIISGPAAPHVY